MWSRTWLVIGRDVIALAVGTWGVIAEELRPAPDLPRMAFFASLMLAPGLLAARWLGRGGGSSSEVPEALPPSSSPSGSGG